MAALTAQDVIRMLDLKPHPEGGYFRETFRDARNVGGRSASTAAYFLLARGERSHWHRVDAAEVWHWHAGAPLQLEIALAPGRIERVTLGGDISAGLRPQASCLLMFGRRRKRWVTGRYSAAPSRRLSILRGSNWRPMTGRRNDRRTPATPIVRRWGQAKYCPPLAVMVEPVISPASSEARNTTQRAISSGSPKRPIGICGSTFFCSTSCDIALTMSVAM